MATVLTLHPGDGGGDRRRPPLTGQELMCEAAELAGRHILSGLPTIPSDDPWRDRLIEAVAQCLGRAYVPPR